MNAFLQRCLDLARLPGAVVEPNPRVGAVVVHNGRIIGEGFHRQHGGPHAEVEAVNSVKNLSLLSESTLYVSLEPCNHFGKTPPCTSLILENRIPKVVIGSLDPNPQMAGNSVELLRKSGVEVIVNPDPAPFISLNQHFWLNQEKRRPFITLKWAESKDGFIAGTNDSGSSIQTTISAPAVSRFVHQLRAQHQAILVGQNTVRIDNPSLTTRRWPGPDPVRIIMDPEASLPMSMKVFASARTIVLNGLKEDKGSELRYMNIANQTLPEILQRLYEEESIGSILVEGGAYTHEKFLKTGAWDECYQNIGAALLGKGVKAPTLPDLDENQIQLLTSYTEGDDTLNHFSKN